MDINLEPPSHNKRGLKIEKIFKSAQGAFAGLVRFLAVSLRKIDELRKHTANLIVIIESFALQAKTFFRKRGFNRSLAYKFLIVAGIAVLPLVSHATSEEQAYEDAIHYSRTIDPIESARFAVYYSQYTPGLYIDADEVALAEVTKNDQYTLKQQLAVNSGKDFEVPGRQDPTYELKRGETVAEVAQKFDLHVGSVIDANGLDPLNLKNVKPGTVLTIPSSDTNTSDDWLVAIKRAEEVERQKAAAEAQKRRDEQARKLASARQVEVRAAGVVAGETTERRVSSDVKIIGTSFSQCVPWAREHSGIGIHGYAGNIATTQSEPKVGGIAFDRFYGHASVVVEVGSDYIVVHEANWIRGKITERRVSRDAIRGYVY